MSSEKNVTTPSRRDAWGELVRLRQSEALALIPAAAVLYLTARLAGSADAGHGFSAILLVWGSYALASILLLAITSLMTAAFLRRGRRHRPTVLTVGAIAMCPLTWILGQNLLTGTKVARGDQSELAGYLAAAAIGLASTFFLHLGWHGRYRKRILRVPAVCAAFIIIGLGGLAECLNLRFLVKQYALWHLALAWFGSTSALIGFSLLADRWSKSRTLLATLSIVLVMSAAAVDSLGEKPASGLGLGFGFSSAARIERGALAMGRRFGILKVPPKPQGDLSLIAGRWGQSKSGRRDEIFARLGISAPKSVILLTIDALRADRTGFGGYRKNATSPFLDRLAAESIVFDRAYAQASFSLPSVMSLFTGRYPASLNSWRAKNDLEAYPGEYTIAELLRLNGFRTVGLPAYPDNMLHTIFLDFKRGFDSYFISDVNQARSAPEVFADALSDLGREPERKSLHWIHLMEVHGPYPQKHTPFGNTVSDQYDHATLTVDRAFEEFWQRATSQGLLKDTLVIVHSDHGEELFDHGGRFHGSELYEEQIHVPLFFWMDGIMPRQVEGPVELVDLLPTIADALDLPLPGRLHGDSLLPTFIGEAPSGLAISQVMNDVVAGKMLVAAIQNDAKVIRNIEDQSTEYYDLSRDPRESNPNADLDTQALDALSFAVERLAGELASPENAGQNAGGSDPSPQKSEFWDWEDLKFLESQLTKGSWRRALYGLWDKRRTPPTKLASLLGPNSPAPDADAARELLVKLIVTEPRPEFETALLTAYQDRSDLETRILLLQGIGGLVPSAVVRASFAGTKPGDLGHRERAHRLVALTRCGDLDAEQQVSASWSNWPRGLQLETWPWLALDADSPFHAALIVAALAPPLHHDLAAFGILALSRRQPTKARDLFSALRLRHRELSKLDGNALSLFELADSKLDLTTQAALYRMFEAAVGPRRVRILVKLDRLGGSLRERFDALHLASRRIPKDRLDLLFEVDPVRSRELLAITPTAPFSLGLSLKITAGDAQAGQIIEGFVSATKVGADKSKIPSRIYVETPQRALLALRERLPDGPLVFSDAKGKTRLTFEAPSAD